MKKTMLLIFTIFFTACSAQTLKPTAQAVRVTRTEPRHCRYIGEVTGNQGNSFTGSWTSNNNLETGARNDMKNKAAAMGGNVVVLMTDRAGQTGSSGMWGGSSHQTNVTLSGTVYRCGRTVARN